MPNLFSYVAIFSWPIVVFFLYRRLPKDRALIASILGGYLLLPYSVGINPPVLPTFDKTLMPALSALLMAWVVKEPAAPRMPPPPAPQPAAVPARPSRARVTPTVASPYARRRADGPAPTQPGPAAVAKAGPAPRSKIELALLVLLFGAPFVTVLTNAEPVVYGPVVLPGLKPYDGFSMGLDALVMVLPYFLGRRYLASPRSHTLLLVGFVLWGLFYSIPALYEIRMSPQLSRDVYGFLAQSFAQTARDGGFRPVVFLQHGLWLAIFFAMTILAAAGLWRVRRAAALPNPGRAVMAMLWLLAVLILCKSLGALVEALLLLPAALFFSVRRQLLLAAIVAGITLFYPALRASNLVPTAQILAMANSISADRGQSLDYRLVNEDALLEKVRQKPVAGWGGYSRNRVFSDTGNDQSVTDGYWIIVFGTAGWLGYIAQYGLLTAPIFLLLGRARRLSLGPMTGSLALLLAANLIDMIPNATLTPLTWIIAGALMGRVGYGGDVEAEPSETAQADGRRPQATQRARVLPATRA